MKSKIAQRIIESTSQSTIDNVRRMSDKMAKTNFNAFLSILSNLNTSNDKYDREYYLNLYSAFLDSKFNSMEEFLKSFFNLK